MRLDRNINSNGVGKYALLKLRVLNDCVKPGAFGELPASICSALKLLEAEGILDWGDKPDTEFFVMRLKDKYARGALAAYATGAADRDPGIRL